jgi:hypothetical protein
MNLGRYVFAQVVDFVPRYLFNKIVSMYKGDFHAKELNSYSQLLHLLFGQLTGCSSLHEICLCLLTHSDILYHLGIRKTVRISSLARANEKGGLSHIRGVRSEPDSKCKATVCQNCDNGRLCGQCLVCIGLHNHLHKHLTCRMGVRKILERCS